MKQIVGDEKEKQLDRSFLWQTVLGCPPKNFLDSGPDEKAIAKARELVGEILGDSGREGHREGQGAGRRDFGGQRPGREGHREGQGAGRRDFGEILGDSGPDEKAIAKARELVGCGFFIGWGSFWGRSCEEGFDEKILRAIETVFTSSQYVV